MTEVLVDNVAKVLTEHQIIGPDRPVGTYTTEYTCSCGAGLVADYNRRNPLAESLWSRLRTIALANHQALAIQALTTTRKEPA